MGIFVHDRQKIDSSPCPFINRDEKKIVCHDIPVIKSVTSCTFKILENNLCFE